MICATNWHKGNLPLSVDIKTVKVSGSNAFYILTIKCLENEVRIFCDDTSDIEKLASDIKLELGQLGRRERNKP